MDDPKKQLKAQRQELEKRITKYNRSRNDAFKLSFPAKNLIFDGIVKFQYTTPEVFSKCLPISSNFTCASIIPNLLSRFHIEGDPASYSIFMEVLDASSAERIREEQLSPVDHPLVALLNICIDGKQTLNFHLRAHEKTLDVNSDDAKAKHVSFQGPQDSLLLQRSREEVLLNDCMKEMCNSERVVCQLAKSLIEALKTIATVNDALRVISAAEPSAELQNKKDRADKAAIAATTAAVIEAKQFVDDLQGSATEWAHQNKAFLKGYTIGIVESLKDLIIITKKVVYGAPEETEQLHLSARKSFEQQEPKGPLTIEEALNIVKHRLDGVIDAYRALTIIQIITEDSFRKDSATSGMCMNLSLNDRVPAALLRFTNRTLVQLLLVTNHSLKTHYGTAAAALVTSWEHVTQSITGSAQYALLISDLKQEIDTEIARVGAIVDKLIFFVRLASGFWPPPDAVADMEDHATRTCVAISQFIIFLWERAMFKTSSFDLSALSNIPFTAPVSLEKEKISRTSRTLIPSCSSSLQIVLTDVDVEHFNINQAVITNLDMYVTQFNALSDSLSEYIDGNEVKYFDGSEASLVEVAVQIRDEIEAMELSRVPNDLTDPVESSKRPVSTKIREIHLATRMATAVWPPPDANDKLRSELSGLRQTTINMVEVARKCVTFQTFRYDEWTAQKEEIQTHKEKMTHMNEVLLGSRSPISETVTDTYLADDEFENMLKEQNDMSNGVVLMDSPPYDIKGGTLERLIVALTHPMKPDATFTDAFMLTFHSFTTPVKLMEHLVFRLDTKPNAKLTTSQESVYNKRMTIPIRLRIFCVLKAWLNRSFDDFHEVPELLQMFNAFLVNMSDGLKSASDSLKKLLDRNLLYGPAEWKGIKSKDLRPPKALLPPSENFTFTELDPLEVARQMAIVDFALYKRIQPRECMDLAWSKKETQHKAKNVLAMINRFNDLMMWVCQTIVEPELATQRIAVIKQWIRVAEKCRQVHNFHAIMAITGGFTTAPIHRLKKTWKLLPKKEQEILDSLDLLISDNNNYKNYRAELYGADMPAIPFLGVYLTDLTFVMDGNNDWIDESAGYINFTKRRMYADVIKKILSFQQTGFNLQAVRSISSFVGNLNISLDENTLYDRSLKVEPR